MPVFGGYNHKAIVLYSCHVIRVVVQVTRTGRQDKLFYIADFVLFHACVCLKLLRANHQLGADKGVKLFLSKGVELHGGFLKSQTLLVSILGNLAGHVIANLGVEASDQHKRLLHDVGNLLLIGLEALDEILLERAHAISEDTGRVEVVTDDEGLVDIEFKLAVHATNRTGNVVTHDLSADHGKGLTLRGVDLARHDGASRLVLR